MKIKEKYEGVSYDARSNFGTKGWWIIILCALTMLTFTSVATLSMNVVVQGKADELGIAYATLVGWNTPAGIIGLFATLGLSQLATKMKLKIVHVASLLLGAVACIFWGLSSSLPGYVIPLIFMFCFMSSTECVSGKMIANWFPKKKGIATGWATMGLNAAGMFMVALLTAIQMSTGQTKYCMFFLAAVLVFTSILTIFFYKDRPEEWNAYPDNDPNSKPEPEIRTGWTVKKVLQQKETWFISIAVGLIAMTTFGLMATIVPSSLMRGMEISTALLLMTITGIIGFVGSYLFGWIDQKFGVKVSTFILCIWLVVGCACFFIPGGTGGWVFVIVMGFTIGATNNYPISMTAQVFGRSGFQVAYGVIYLIKGIFQYLYGIIFTLSLTSTGGYGLAWLIMGIPDPEYWCHHGYAVVKFDPRGTNNSEGDITQSDSQEATDLYDLIEQLGVLPWTNGKIGMSGDSGPAVAQWFAASMQPPHLAAIAPWEGITDHYRELICIGGIPECGFNPFLTYSFYGANDMEDLYLNTKEHPYFDEYWEEKLMDLSKIEVPAYITAGWTHFHLRGTVNGYRHISSKQKWIRFYRDFEWENYYNGENMEDLKRFFDRYLKGIRNGWESTPRVRMDVMDAYDFDFMKRRPEEDFPLPRTEYRKYYLNAAKGSMEETLPAVESEVKYDAKKGKTFFDIKFNEDTELTGYMKLKLWVEAEGADDMDLFVAIQKLDKDGKFIPTNIIGAPHPGSVGRLRVSLRALDEEKSTDFNPVNAYKNPQKLKAGEIVEAYVEIWPLSRFWHKGEQLRVEIAGFFHRENWFEPFDYDTINEGKHIIHTGGKYDSYLQVPYIPPKYIAGDYIYR